ncbi:hypothetical protein EQH57_0001 [Dictyocoela roeselum]|nr:hypothetical protein EQH57_0001 [Dictyocoela roeselum]
MNSIKIIKSQKNKKKKLIHSNYIYNLDKKYNNFICWRCIRRDCRGRIRTNLESTIILSNNLHWHEEEHKRLLKIKLNENLKKSALRTNDDFEECLNRSILGMNESEKMFIGKYDSLRDYFTRLRNSKLNNDAGHELNILDSYKYTFDGQLFLQSYNKIENKNGYLLFGTNKSLDLLKKSKLWLLDGTFYTAPKGFSQIYIIYSEVFNKIVPLIYILMKSKTQEAYKMIFMEIREKIDCPPKMLIMDFEISVFNAVRDVFPDIETRGCNFHFSQIVVKFMNENKMLAFYNYNKDFKRFVKFLMILAFVPEEKVEEEFF